MQKVLNLSWPQIEHQWVEISQELLILVNVKSTVLDQIKNYSLTFSKKKVKYFKYYVSRNRKSDQKIYLLTMKTKGRNLIKDVKH